MVSWSKTSATANFLLLLIGLNCLNAAAAQKPWDVFSAFVTRTATSLIEASTDFENVQTAPSQSLQNLASSIVSAVEAEEDAKLGKKVSEFGYAFFCLVWAADVPAEYEGVLNIGEPTQIESYLNRKARNGAAILEGCYQNQAAKLPRQIGDLGWPCPFGSAILLQARMVSGPLLNCVVHYYPEASGEWRASPDCILDKYTPALAATLQAGTHARLRSFTAPSAIDLTQLAADLTREVLSRCNYGKHSSIYGFRAIVVVPAYAQPDPRSQRGLVRNVVQSNYVGLVAKGGHVLIDHLHVPMRPQHHLDLNLPPQPATPITLHIFIAIPSLLSSDGPLPECGLCRMSQSWGGRC